MKHGAVIKARFDVFLKIRSGFRRLFKIQNQFDITEIGVQCDHGQAACENDREGRL